MRVCFWVRVPDLLVTDPAPVLTCLGVSFGHVKTFECPGTLLAHVEPILRVPNDVSYGLFKRRVNRAIRVEIVNDSFAAPRAVAVAGEYELVFFRGVSSVRFELGDQVRYRVI